MKRECPGPLILALNPSIDAEWRVAEVKWEEKNIVRSERRWGGGKGINVCRWLRFLGSPGELIIPSGGTTGRELEDGLRLEELRVECVRIEQPTRVNVIVTTEAGAQMRFNPMGPVLSGLEWEEILSRTNDGLGRSGCLVLSGSLPRGLPATAYRELTELARGKGLAAFLDCDGEAFSQALGAGPFLVKPNEHELAAWAGRELKSEGECLGASEELSRRTGGWVLASRGGAGGLLANAGMGEYWTAAAPKVETRNTVGAGDALLAAVVRQAGLGASAKDWLRWGVAAGTAATQMPAGVLPGPGMIEKMAERVEVAAAAGGAFRTRFPEAGNPL